jgi:hypothetical protein
MVWKKDETTLNVTVSRENPNRALGRMIIKEDGGQITIRSEPHLNSVLGELNLLNRLRHGLQIDIDKVKTDEIVATSRARAPAAPPRILRVDEIAAGMNQIFASVKPSLHARIEEGRIIVHNNSRGDLGYFTLINNGGTATLRTARPTAAVLNTLKVWESLQRFASQHQLTLTWKDTP